MSGPKCSEYTLTPEQRRKLDEERLCKFNLQIEEYRKKNRREELEKKMQIESADNNIAVAFSSFAETSNKTNIKTDSTETRLINQLNSMLTDNQLSMDLIPQIEAKISRLCSITDKNYRKNFIAVSIKPLLKEYEQYKELKIKHEVLCSISDVSYQPIKFSDSSLENLNQEISWLESKIAEDEEKAYIQKSIDEVMSDMGYDVIGHRDVTKKSGKHFRNELYSYEDGTAVNVTFSDDGDIAMELCGLDDTDRLPETSEANQLCDCMESFCKDFTEIEKRLKVKGVVLKRRLHMLPPDVEHAQIINVSEYESESNTTNFKDQRKHKVKSKTLQRNV